MTWYADDGSRNADGSPYSVHHAASWRYYGHIVELSYRGAKFRVPIRDKSGRDVIDLKPNDFKRFFGTGAMQRQPKGGFKVMVHVIGKLPKRVRKAKK